MQRGRTMPQPEVSGAEVGCVFVVRSGPFRSEDGAVETMSSPETYRHDTFALRPRSLPRIEYKVLRLGITIRGSARGSMRQYSYSKGGTFSRELAKRTVTERILLMTLELRL